VTLLRTVLLRGVVLALGWWILTEGDRDSVGFGVVIASVALSASLWLEPPAPQTWRVLGMVRFTAHFLYRSLRGGIDVARRAFAPRLPLEPGLRSFPTRLPPGPARDLFSATLSLMPGTLAVEQGEGGILVHVLVDGASVTPELADLEARVAEATGTELRGD
jgi:multicomponent Na+:H+ antiporter subunit E